MFKNGEMQSQCFFIEISICNGYQIDIIMVQAQYNVYK